MIDFEKELEKFKPVMEIEDLERELLECDLRDMVELVKSMIEKE